MLVFLGDDQQVRAVVDVDGVLVGVTTKVVTGDFTPLPTILPGSSVLSVTGHGMSSRRSRVVSCEAVVRRIENDTSTVAG